MISQYAMMPPYQQSAQQESYCATPAFENQNTHSLVFVDGYPQPPVDNLFATEEEALYFDDAEFDAPLPDYYLR